MNTSEGTNHRGNQDSSQNHRPVTQIVISSDQDSKPAVPMQPEEPVEPIQTKKAVVENELGLKEVVKPNMQEQDQRRRQMLQQMIRKQLQEQELHREEIQRHKKLLAERAAQRLQKQRMETNLKKQFSEYSSFLPISSLTSVKAELENFQDFCIFEVDPQYPYSQALRQQSRKKLTTGLMFTLQEIKLKVKTGKTLFQEKILNPQADALRYCYTVASELQTYFFQNLVKKIKLKKVQSKPSREFSSSNNLQKYSKEKQSTPEQLYSKQIKVILTQFSDRNNLPFRREILNRKAKYQALVTATDQSLKCQKTKQDERRQRLQFLRQNSLDPHAFDQPEKQQPAPEAELNRFNSISSMNSISQPMIEQPKETPQQKEAREAKEKNQRIKAFQLKYKACCERFMKQLRSMQRREDILKQKHGQNQFFVDLCSKMNLQ